MLKNSLNTSVLLLLFASACTQQPARVELKGQQSFTRGSQSAYSRPNSNQSSYSSGYNSSHNSSHNSSYNSSYNSNSSYENPVSENTEQIAPVNSIGISDLSPPSSSGGKPGPDAKPETEPDNTENKNTENKNTGDKNPAKKNGRVLKTTINPWTNKPRSANEPQAAVIKKEVKSEPKSLPAKNKNITGLKWPVAGKTIISSFGSKGAGKANDGINIAATAGDPVWAAADGEVVYVSNELKGYGNMVFIKHPGGKTSSYAHLSRITVDKYERVKQGDVIGYVGSTGNVKTPQLFFSLHKGKEAIDPQKYMSRELVGL